MEQKILDIILLIKSETLLFFTYIPLILLIMIIVRDTKVLTVIVNYFSIRFSKIMCKGTKIRICGIDGWIDDYNFKAIAIRTINGDMMYIPMKDWKNYVWIVKEDDKLNYVKYMEKTKNETKKLS